MPPIIHPSILRQRTSNGCRLPVAKSDGRAPSILRATARTGKTRCRADRMAADLPATAWTRRSAGDGSKGPRFYDWAWLADVGADGDLDNDGQLDQHQVRRWTSWHRFTTLALAALAVLAICAADARAADRDAQPDMIALTVNEIRRLINVLLTRPTRSIAHRLRWSNWRRRHQAGARRAHYAHRLNLEFQP